MFHRWSIPQCTVDVEIDCNITSLPLSPFICSTLQASTGLPAGVVFPERLRKQFFVIALLFVRLGTYFPIRSRRLFEELSYSTAPELQIESIPWPNGVHKLGAVRKVQSEVVPALQYPRNLTRVACEIVPGFRAFFFEDCLRTLCRSGR